jgi:hypothetical protein
MLHFKMRLWHEVLSLRDSKYNAPRDAPPTALRPPAARREELAMNEQAFHTVGSLLQQSCLWLIRRLYPSLPC